MPGVQWLGRRELLRRCGLGVQTMWLHAPSPGDVAICLHCAHIHIYAEDLTLRQPNDAEIVDIAGDEEIIRMMAALGELRMHEALYINERFDERACDHCGKPYRGPAVYCSLKCAQADA